MFFGLYISQTEDVFIVYGDMMDMVFDKIYEFYDPKCDNFNWINLLTQCIKMTNDKRRMLNNLIINRSEKRKTQLLMKVVKNLINSDSLNKKFYLISLSKYTKSCSNREVKLKNFIILKI